MALLPQMTSFSSQHEQKQYSEPRQLASSACVHLLFGNTKSACNGAVLIMHPLILAAGLSETCNEGGAYERSHSAPDQRVACCVFSMTWFLVATRTRDGNSLEKLRTRLRRNPGLTRQPKGITNRLEYRPLMVHSQYTIPVEDRKPFQDFTSIPANFSCSSVTADRCCCLRRCPCGKALFIACRPRSRSVQPAGTTRCNRDP